MVIILPVQIFTLNLRASLALLFRLQAATIAEVMKKVFQPLLANQSNPNPNRAILTCKPGN